MGRESLEILTVNRYWKGARGRRLAEGMSGVIEVSVPGLE